jgi:hypothetical protein
VLADAGTALTLNGAVTGSGSLLVKGGGTVAITNGTALDVPITVSGATLAMPQSTEYDAAFTIGSGGAVFAPAYGATVTVWSGLTGPGGLTKTGSSFLTLAGGASLAGELMVRNGTVSMTNEPQADLVVGEGTSAIRERHPRSHAATSCGRPPPPRPQRFSATPTSPSTAR